MDIAIEKERSVSPDKHPTNVVLARLEVIYGAIEQYGVDDELWDWYQVLCDMIIPSLLHPALECRTAATDICVLLYKNVGNDIKNIISDVSIIKPNLRENIISQFNNIDNVLKKDLDLQNDLRVSQKKDKNKNLKKSLNDDTNIKSSMDPILEADETIEANDSESIKNPFKKRK